MITGFPARQGPEPGDRAERASIVRLIFDEYADRLSPRHVATKLEEDGISSPSGGKWNDSTIRGAPRRETARCATRPMPASRFTAVTASWVNAAIERLHDRLETDEVGEALLAHLKAREAERYALTRRDWYAAGGHPADAG